MNNSTGSKKKTLYNFFSVALLQIGNYVLPMITLPIISRIIGPEKYGVVNYSFAFVGYFVLFINAGFDFYGTRMILANKGNEQRTNELFSSILLSKALLLLISIIVFIAALFLIPQLYNEKLVSIFTFMMCIGWVINPSWLYNGMQDSRKYAIFSFASKLLFSIAVILVVRHKSDYIYHPLITSVAHVLVSLISFYYAIRKYKISFTWINWPKIRETLKDNRHLSIIWWITNQALSTNIVLAGFLLSTLQIGYYSAALRIIIIVQSIISMPLNTVLFPYIGEAFVKGYKDGITRVTKAFPYLFFISLGMSLVTLLFAKQVILVFYGRQFAEAVNLLKIASIVLFFTTLNGAFGQQVLLNLKKDATYVKIITTGFILNILLLLVFIHFWGMAGAAFAWPVAEIVIFLVYMFYFKARNIKIFDSQYYQPRFICFNVLHAFKLGNLKKT
jgi:O-antigen/teichoic acid export membrane protein